MKSLVIIGSRNPLGKTSMAAEAFSSGFATKGCSEKIFLVEKNIERCRQCDASGWGLCRNEGICVIEDDFLSIVERLRQSDIVVFATPVYFGDMSESIKTFLDRLRRITRNEKGKAGIYEKPAIGICVAGGGGGGAVSCCFFMERVLAACGFTVEDMIPCRRQNLELKKSVLVGTGKWFAEILTSGT
ncbi:MAG: flavodoxin family protein [Candidatus Omnitrophica bacterium]|nr:flavodoxin family protein [Candidatus Omnitrophota bacterium]MCM8816825.1 flavodoxin family protein [Candidatus Omnitrophota bacterium]